MAGTAAIREVLGGLLAVAETFELEFGNALEADGVALVHSNRTLKGAAPDGHSIDMSGKTAGVFRRQPDGTWRIAIDNPWGIGGDETQQ